MPVELLAMNLNPRALESIRLRRSGWYRSRQVSPLPPEAPPPSYTPSSAAAPRSSSSTSYPPAMDWRPNSFLVGACGKP